MDDGAGVRPGRVRLDTQGALLRVDCRHGSVLIGEVQIAGRNRIPAKDFANGYRKMFEEDRVVFGRETN